MTGTWTISRRPPISIDTFTSPEDGWMVNSHIIEFPSQLFVVDAQYTLPYAKEVTAPLKQRFVHLLGALPLSCCPVEYVLMR
jgi:hypothetical protein